MAIIASVKILKYISQIYGNLDRINLEPVYVLILAFLIFGDSEENESNFFYVGSTLNINDCSGQWILKNRKKLKKKSNGLTFPLKFYILSLLKRTKPINHGVFRF